MIDFILDLLFPPKCMLCDVILTINEKKLVCDKCLPVIDFITEDTCEVCGRIIRKKKFNEKYDLDENLKKINSDFEIDVLLEEKNKIVFENELVLEKQEDLYFENDLGSEELEIFENELVLEEEIFERKLALEEEIFENKLVLQEEIFENKLVLEEEIFENKLVLEEEIFENKLVLEEEIFENQLVLEEEIFENKLVSEELEIFENKLVLEEEIFERKLVLKEDEIFENELISEELEIFENELVSEEELFENQLLLEEEEIFENQLVLEELEIFENQFFSKTQKENFEIEFDLEEKENNFYKNQPILNECKTCQKCLQEKHFFIRNYSPFVYDDIISTLIKKFKYQNHPEYSRGLAMLMFEYYKKNVTQKIDYLVEVPMFKPKEKIRGFNQAKLLCVELSKLTKIPVLKNLLVRVKNTKPQSKLNSRARKNNLSKAFLINKKHKINYKTILLIDDIYTTGSTIDSCSEVLLSNGASYVYSFCLAVAMKREKKQNGILE